MTMMYRIGVLAVIGCALGACGHAESNSSQTTGVIRDSVAGSIAGTVPLAPAGVDTTKATGPLSPNHLGRIPVLEYHLIGDHDALYSRTRDHFRRDLEYAYARGYRPITISQMLDKNFSDVPLGMSPIVIVFDDASPEQFRYVDQNGTLEIDPTSGVGIWLDFEKSHPGWRRRAVFCLLNGAKAGHSFFGDSPRYEGQHRQWRFQKVKWLADQGFELCDHTVWHAMLNKFSDAVVQEQIARNVMAIDSAVPGYKIRTMALPYGIWPANRHLAWEGSWTDPKTHKTLSYHFDAILEVSGGPTRSPYDPQFNPHSITRIEAIGEGIRRSLDKLDQTRTRFVK